MNKTIKILPPDIHTLELVVHLNWNVKTKHNILHFGYLNLLQPWCKISGTPNIINCIYIYNTINMDYLVFHNTIWCFNIQFNTYNFVSIKTFPAFCTIWDQPAKLNNVYRSKEVMQLYAPQRHSTAAYMSETAIESCTIKNHLYRFTDLLKNLFMFWA